MSNEEVRTRAELGVTYFDSILGADESLIGFLNSDDLEHAPDWVIDKILEYAQIKSVSKAKNRLIREMEIEDANAKGLSHEAEALNIVGSIGASGMRGSWLVDRPESVDEVCEAFQDGEIVVLEGGHGSGRSHFWRRDLSPSKTFRALAPLAAVVDACALRMRSPAQLELDALYSQFVNDEDAFARYKATLGKSAPPFTTYVLQKLAFVGGVVVIDHAENLRTHPAIVNWLRTFVTTMKDHGVKVLLIDNGDKDGVVHKVCGKARTVRLGNFGREQIRNWWHQPCFAGYSRSGLSANLIYQATGGTPRLVRDFGRFLDSNGSQLQTQSARKFVISFTKDCQKQFSPELERLLSLLRQCPRHVEGLLTDGEDYYKSILHMDKATLDGGRGVTRNDFLDDLVRTGAVVISDDGTPRFASPILARKFEFLIDPRQLCCLFQTGTLDQLASTKRAQEVVGAVLRDSLLQNIEVSEGWKRLNSVLCRRGLSNVRVYGRDKANAKLWSLIFGDVGRGASGSAKCQSSFDRLGKVGLEWPLHSDTHPDFALAVQSGRIVHREGKEVYLPVAGENGRVSIVIAGQWGSHVSLTDRSALRALWRLVMTLQPAIAVNYELFVAHRADTEIREGLYRLRAQGKHSDNQLSQLLKIANCSAVGVLEKGTGSWVLTRFADVTSGQLRRDEPSWKPVLEMANPALLSRIADHPTRRGLVLDGNVQQYFPELQSQGLEASFFVLPVWTHDENRCRLVVFVFEGDGAYSIGGMKQQTLSILGSPLAASA